MEITSDKVSSGKGGRSTFNAYKRILEILVWCECRYRRTLRVELGKGRLAPSAFPGSRSLTGKKLLKCSAQRRYFLHTIRFRDSSLGYDGKWPSFHDAEVLSVNLDRGKAEGLYGPTVTIALHGFEITNELNEKSHYSDIEFKCSSVMVVSVKEGVPDESIYA